VRDGRQTTEFKMAVLGAVAGIVLVIVGLTLEDPWSKSIGGAMVTWSVYGYARSRGDAKSGTPVPPNDPPKQP